MHVLLLSMSAHLTEQLGMAPGGEFRRALKEVGNGVLMRYSSTLTLSCNLFTIMSGVVGEMEDFDILGTKD